jgi:hypothetical protein
MVRKSLVHAHPLPIGVLGDEGAAWPPPSSVDWQQPMLATMKGGYHRPHSSHSALRCFDMSGPDFEKSEFSIFGALILKCHSSFELHNARVTQ